MSDQKFNPSSIAAKIAQSNKESKEALDKAAEEAGTAGVTTSETDESNDSGIQVGATAGGSMMSNHHRPAGVANVAKAPGYYSRHAGKVRIGQKTWPWPMEAPLVPKEGEEELKEYLDSMVERGIATYHAGDSKSNDSE